VAASKSSKGLPAITEDLNIGSVTNAVKGKVGNLLGKGVGLGGLSSLGKLGGGSWF
jgi:hypothetical protein